MLCRIGRGRVSLIARQDPDWTKATAGALVVDLKKSPFKTAWLDGEIAARRAELSKPGDGPGEMSKSVVS
jgi:ATP-dependent DNA ligase